MGAFSIPPTIGPGAVSGNITIPDTYRLKFNNGDAELYYASDIHGAGRDAIILSTQDTIVIAAGANMAENGYVQMGTSSATYEHFRWQHNGNATITEQTPGSKKHIFASYYWSGGVGTNYRAMAMRHRTSTAGVGTIDWYANDPVTSGKLDNGTHIFSIREGIGAFFPSGYGIGFEAGGTITANGTGVAINSLALTTALPTSSGGTGSNNLYDTLRFQEHFVGGNNSDGQIGVMGWRIYATAGSGSGAYQAGEANYPGIYRLTTGAVSGDGQQIVLAGGSQSSIAAATGMAMAFAVKIRLGSTASIRMTCGLGNGVSTVATRYMGIRYDTTAGDTNFMLVAYDADGTENSSVSLGVAADTSFHFFEVERVSSTSIRGRCDGGSWQTLSSEVPAGQYHSPFFAVLTKTSSAKTADIDLFAMEMKTN